MEFNKTNKKVDKGMTKVDKDLNVYLDSKKDNKVILKDGGFIDMGKLSSEKKTELDSLQEEILKFRDYAKVHKSAFEREMDITDESLTNADYTRNEMDKLMKSGKRLSVTMKVPLVVSVINQIESEVSGSDGIQYSVKGSTGPKTKAVQIILDDVFKKTCTEDVLATGRNQLFTYGFSCLKEGIKSDSKKIRGNEKSFSGKLYDMSNVLTTKIINKITVCSTSINPRYIYLDPQAKETRDLTKLVETELVGEDYIRRNFLSKENNKYFYNIEKVNQSLKKDIQDNKNQSMDFNSMKAEDYDNTMKNVITHYFDTSEDIYAILINGLIVFSSHNPYGHRKLPYIFNTLKKDGEYIYGSGGYPNGVRSFSKYINGVYNVSLESMIRGKQQGVFLGEGVSFDGYEGATNAGSMLKVKGSVNEVKPFTIDNEIKINIELLENLNTYAIAAIGVDLRDLSKSGITKFEAGLNETNKQKRIAVLLRELSSGYEKLFGMRIENLSYFFDELMTDEEFVEGSKVKKTGKKIGKKLKVEGFSVNQKDGKTTFEKDSNSDGEMEVMKEMLEGALKFTITTPYSKNKLTEVQKEDLLSGIKVLSEFRQSFPEAKFDDGYVKMLQDNIKTLFNMEEKDLESLDIDQMKGKESLDKIDEMIKALEGSGNEQEEVTKAKGTSKGLSKEQKEQARLDPKVIESQTQLDADKIQSEIKQSI